MHSSALGFIHEFNNLFIRMVMKRNLLLYFFEFISKGMVSSVFLFMNAFSYKFRETKIHIIYICFNFFF